MNHQWTTYAIQCNACPNTSWCRSLDRLLKELADEGWETREYGRGVAEHYCPTCREKR